jgi:DNA polymerase-3 subunit chi
MQSTFYVLKQPDEPQCKLPAHFDLGCRLAADLFRAGKRVFIFTDSQAHAHQVDEHLWAFEADSFVPHNLVGEGPRNGAPVEISWQKPTNHRGVLINLATLTPAFISQFREVIDFVPADDTRKQAARERYKQYRQAGYQLTTNDQQ